MLGKILSVRFNYKKYQVISTIQQAIRAKCLDELFKV